MDRMIGSSGSICSLPLLQQQYMRGTPASWQVLLVTSENRDTPAWVCLSANNSVVDLPSDIARMSRNIRWASKLDVRNFVFFRRFYDENIILRILYDDY